MPLSFRHLTSTKQLSRSDADAILAKAKEMDAVLAKRKQDERLKGKILAALFYEPSTRTRSSFEVAASRLSADVTHFDIETSSVTKGESVVDTVETLEAMKVDYIVVRHKQAGIPELIARSTHASVINAGDGFHAHPTQALLDAFTIKETFGELQGRRVVIVGDIKHSRVARSTSLLLRRLGLKVAYLAPGSLMPRDTPKDVTLLKSWDELWAWKPEVTYLLRVQMERQREPFFPSVGEYHKIYGMTDERLARVRDQGLYVMHPGPVNRGVELNDNVMTYERSLINQQVENGIAVRMSVLYWLRPGAGV